MNSSGCSMTSINPGHCEKAASVAKIPFPEKCGPGITEKKDQLHLSRTNMADRRQFERFSVNILDMNGKMMFARNVKVVNISMGGISFKADRRLNIGRNYTIKLENRDQVLTMEGSVVSSVLSESQKDPAGDVIPVYTAGMKFTKVSDESRLKEIIDSVIDRRE